MTRLVRLVTSSAGCAVLATLLGAHALSSASTRNSPHLAAQTFPSNGRAHERLAYSQFLEAVKNDSAAAVADAPMNTDPEVRPISPTAPDQALLQSSAQAMLSDVREAIRHEPLLPRAHALLVIGAKDSQKRRELLTRASLLNRRDVVLQGLVLEQHIADIDYNASILTLDQLLRVHPERSQNFFPILTQALAVDGTVPVFAQLLESPLPWRDAFLGSAVADERARLNLARLRERIDFGNLEFDRRLISGLVAQGEIAAAADLYTAISTPPAREDAKPSLAWRAEYPPFDWQLADDAGLRAQPGDDPEKLEISVRPGRGGVLAARVLQTPAAPFAIGIAHDVTPVGQIEDVRLQLTCAGATAPFYDESFTAGVSRFAVQTVPDACDHLRLVIFGRSWSGLPALRGTISTVAVLAGP